MGRVKLHKFEFNEKVLHYFMLLIVLLGSKTGLFLILIYSLIKILISLLC